MSSSAADPTFLLEKFTPEPGDPHGTAHPMVKLPQDLSRPFTLLTNPPPPADSYSIGFNCNLGPNGGSARLYMAAFLTSVSSPTWWNSLAINSSEVKRVRFTKTDLGNGTNLWLGAWWDDGTYAGTLAGVTAYFAAHGIDGGHHSVPIITG